MTWRLRLVLIVLAGLALRVGYVFAYRRHVTPTGDAFYFHYQADLLAQGKGFIDPYSLFWAAKVVPGATHPPLWTLVLALAAALGSTTFFAQLLWSCAIGTTSIAAVAWRGARSPGPGPGSSRRGSPRSIPSSSSTTGRYWPRPLSSRSWPWWCGPSTGSGTVPRFPGRRCSARCAHCAR